MSTRRSFLFRTGLVTLSAMTSARVAGERHKDSTERDSGSRDSVLKLAIVGTGKISHRYLKQAAVSKKARFVATCARHLDSAKARAIEYGIGTWFDDYAAMYDAVKPDGVIIATPNSLHAAPAIAALERRIAVLCEKPMATTWRDCQRMVAAAMRNRTVFLCLPYDANSQFLAALGQLTEANLGVFTGAEAQLLWPGAPWDNWYYDRNVVGGGAGLETIVYPMSRLISLLGPARRVTGFSNTLIPHRILAADKGGLVPPRDPRESKVVGSNVDDNSCLVVEWPLGQQALVRAMWNSSMVRNDTTIYGRHGTLWITNDELIVQALDRVIPDAEAVTWNGYKNCYRVPFERIMDVSQEGLVDHFADCIRGISQPRCGGQQQLHVHEILFKGYEAARTGVTQRLETTFTPWHEIEPSFSDTLSRPL